MFKFKYTASKAQSAFFVSSCLTLYILFFVPSEIFTNNPNEFSYIFSEIIPYLLVPSFIVIALFTFLAPLLNQKIFNVLMVILISLAILFWIEGKMLYRDYGPLDGRMIIWDKWEMWGYIDVLIWITLIMSSIIFRNYIIRFIRPLSIILLITFMVNFFVAYDKLEESQKKRYILDESTIANFSIDSNIIVLVIDELQSDIFYEIIKTNPSVRDYFEGFVYYPDTISGYPWTVPSIPLILTGQYYNNSELFSEYLKRAFLEKSFLNYLVYIGYRVELYPKFYDRNYYKSRKIAANAIRTGDILSFDDAKLYMNNLINLSLFKISPHVIRKNIYNDLFIFKKDISLKNKHTKNHMSWGSNDGDFRKNIKENSRLIYLQPAFKFFHLRGSHAPWYLDSSGRYIKSDGSRKNYRDHVTYNLGEINKLFNEFRTLGIYNSSTIYIISDHGAGRSINTKLKTEILDNDIDESENVNIPYQVKARASSIFLKKLPNSSGSLKISNRAFSSSEFPSEVLRDMGATARIVNKYSNIAKHQNQRRYLYYMIAEKGEFLPELYEYFINGNSWLDSSWSGPVNIYTELRTYKRLWSLDFRKAEEEGPATIYVSSEGPIFTANNDNQYKIEFKNTGNDSLLLNIAYNFRDEIDTEYADIYLNQRKIKRLRIEDNFKIIEKPFRTIPIDKQYLNPQNNIIKIKFSGNNHSLFSEVFYSVALYEENTK